MLKARFPVPSLLELDTLTSRFSMHTVRPAPYYPYKQCIEAHYLYIYFTTFNRLRVEPSSLDAVENWPIHLDTMRYRHTTYNPWYRYKLCTLSLVKFRHLYRHCWTAYFTVLFMLYMVFISGDAMYDKCQVEASFCLIFLAGGSLLLRLPITDFRFALHIFPRTRRRVWVNSQAK